ncbi:threonine synthase [Caldivirga maquilingensis]|uniref:Pyridoxal-5'-phosphate-dependent protein beta subunit n=1 Tax=Caldivirga maquilingensis (strain ATCC 700844 / DSM 13496 / JCM 10307 / IC-167) TaxID=397948 RepID=A8MDP7_CALMQ|nr:pyridoxal-phosphate dependent enzyme [Caldivirga maquilingensis]ABW01903.1 Pyridoxal-5'-phosphate-dependent protein beta subunit [Caldivirga maquilingensis IC-167]
MVLNLTNMSGEVTYKCPKCGFTTEANTWLIKCPRCGSPLNVNYDLRRPRELSRSELTRILPVKEPLSLGEGLTPLVRRGDYYFKLEYLNPTGSFKDRGWSLALSVLRNDVTVVEDSSGNAGLSLAAYSAVKGVRARIYVPKTAPEAKKRLMRLLGANVVEAATRADASSLAMSFTEGVYVGHSWNPFFIHGVKLIAYELALELGNIDNVVAPLGNGTLTLGLYLGFKEAEELKLIKDTPRIIAVEASGYEWAYSMLHNTPMGVKATLPDGIIVPQPPRLTQIIDAIRDTGGDVVVVNDQGVIEGLREGIRLGFIIEPTSAVVFKALKEVNLSGTTVVILTGSGLKLSNELYRLIYGE